MTAIRYPAFCLAPLVLFASGAQAQEAIAYDTGDYAYPQEARDVAPVPAPDAAIVFREKAVVQPIPSIDPDTQVSTDAAMSEPAPVVAEAAPATQILYAYPAVYAQPPAPGGASRVIYREGDPRAAGGYTYVYESSVPTLPAGGRIVEFDREGWLAECRRRIAPVTYNDDGDNGDWADNRGMASESGNDGGRCEAYLDGYMESARTGGLHGHTSSSGDYMLVPVTVMVPQRAVYGDGMPVER